MAGYRTIVGVTVRSPVRPELQIELVVHTGFVGSPTFPPATMRASRLPFDRQIPANLADNTTIAVDVHKATVRWEGREPEVEVLVTGARPLLGTILLAGQALAIDFIDDGHVAIDPLSR